VSLASKPLELINEQDLNDLIANRVRELKTIEYKLILPGSSNDDKKEFLADVSSFANASGGDIIYGMREEDATAVELVGLDLPSIDKEILRLEGIIREGLDPRLPNVMIKPLMLLSGRVSFLIRVKRSWLLPHRVKYGGTSRFYSRTSAGKYELDVSELRPLFALSTTATERIRDFRTERLSKIMAQEIPVRLNDNPRIVLHTVPMMAVDPSTRVDISSLKLETDRLEPMGFMAGPRSGPQYNFDGLLTYARDDELVYSYLQLFRNGSVEAVDATTICRSETEGLIPAGYERRVLKTISNVVSIQKQLGVEPPLFVMLTLLGVKDYRMAFDGVSSWTEGHPIDEINLIIPETMFEDFSGNIEDKMAETFQIVWNAAGYAQSPIKK
jgi:hypothetical protein